MSEQNEKPVFDSADALEAEGRRLMAEATELRREGEFLEDGGKILRGIQQWGEGQRMVLQAAHIRAATDRKEYLSTGRVPESGVGTLRNHIELAVLNELIYIQDMVEERLAERDPDHRSLVEDYPDEQVENALLHKARNYEHILSLVDAGLVDDEAIWQETGRISDMLEGPGKQEEQT